MNGQLTASVKFEEFAEQWFKEYAEIKLKAQTIRNYRYFTERTYKAIGHMRMDKITTRTIQRFITQLTETPKTDQHGDTIEYLSPKTIKNYISFISSVFDFAVKQQLVNANPCKNVTLPTVIQKERNVYSMEEVQQILDWLDEEKRTDIRS